ncbi:MAG: hypothetical protein M1824_001946 [Vezdaea acicularis]|nr:MAG: hypothetical protein M1824_001946 [Vezdaea acicularis]
MSGKLTGVPEVDEARRKKSGLYPAKPSFRHPKFSLSYLFVNDKMMQKQRNTAQSTGPRPVAVPARDPSSYPVIAPPPSTYGGVPVFSAPSFDSVHVFFDPMPLYYHQGMFPGSAAAGGGPYPTYHAAPPPLPYYGREPIFPGASTTNYFAAPPHPNYGGEPASFVDPAAPARPSANPYQNQAAPRPMEQQRPPPPPPQRPPPVAPYQPSRYREGSVVPTAQPAPEFELPAITSRRHNEEVEAALRRPESPVIMSLRHNEELEAAFWRLAPPWEDDWFEH